MMIEEQSEAWADAEALARAQHRLPMALLGNAFMRIAGGASGVLVGLYLADLANRGAHVDAALVGTLGAMSFGDELLFTKGGLSGSFRLASIRRPIDRIANREASGRRARG
jgi:hypothetical protein